MKGKPGGLAGHLHCTSTAGTFMSEFVEQLRDVVAGFRGIECELERDMLPPMLPTCLEEKLTRVRQMWLQTGSDRS